MIVEEIGLDNPFVDNVGTVECELFAVVKMYKVDFDAIGNKEDEPDGFEEG